MLHNAVKKILFYSYSYTYIFVHFFLHIYLLIIQESVNTHFLCLCSSIIPSLSFDRCINRRESIQSILKIKKHCHCDPKNKEKRKASILFQELYNSMITLKYNNFIPNST